jgi:hypothetical protein
VERDHYEYVEFAYMQSVPLCYSMIARRLVSWLVGFKRSYIAMETMMASQLRVCFTYVLHQQSLGRSSQLGVRISGTTM